MNSMAYVFSLFSQFELRVKISYFSVLNRRAESFFYFEGKALSHILNHYLRKYLENNFANMLRYFNDFPLIPFN